MKINQKQIEAVLKLTGPERFKHFIKVVSDQEEVWGLYQEGWALSALDDGTTVFPIWPAEAYAQICAQNEWSAFVPRAISLNDFMDTLLPQLRSDGVLPGVFLTTADRGVTPPVDELLDALNAELQNYE